MIPCLMNTVIEPQDLFPFDLFGVGTTDLVQFACEIACDVVATALGQVRVQNLLFFCDGSLKIVGQFLKVQLLLIS